MAINYQTFKGVSSVTLGSTSIYGVTSINIQQTWAEIHASGDGDTHEPIAGRGTCRTNVTINTVDPTDADSVTAESGTLGATYEDAMDDTDKTLAVVGCTVVGINQVVNKDNASGGTISLVAASADGTTTPVSIS